MPYINTDELLNSLPDDLPYKASVKRVLMQAPEADVEKLIRRQIDLHEECTGLKKAKSEVAREIFEEIEKSIDNKFSINHGVVLIIKEDFAELKKKYTEDNDG